MFSEVVFLPGRRICFAYYFFVSQTILGFGWQEYLLEHSVKSTAKWQFGGKGLFTTDVCREA